MTPLVDVVIVNWNGGRLVHECVQSLVDADPARELLDIVLVDNASTDGSAGGLPERARPVTVVRNTVNRGFAAACNQGAASGTGKYVLFLNPDTRVSRASIERVCAFMEEPRNDHVGICGIQLRDGSGEISRSCSRHPTPARMLASLVALDRVVPRLVPPHMMAEWDHADSRDVDQVIGAFYFVRRDLFEQLGGFDERFFVYYEEVDFARRAHALGFRTHFLAEASAYHEGGGTTNSVRAFRQFLLTQSRALYAFKHFPRVLAVLNAVGTLAVEPAVRMVFFAAKGDMRSVRESWRAAAMLWHGAGQLLRGVEIPGTRPVSALPGGGRA